jgi:GNAT superfamily N-acetyltransferase
MFMQIEITKATNSDVPALVEILTLATHYKLHHNDHSWGARPFTAAEVSRNLAQGGTYKVVTEGGEIVGTFELAWEDEVWGKQPAAAGYLHRLAVKEGWHHHGLGTQIINWAAVEVKRQNRQLLRLDCDARNAQLRAYYEENGFQLAKIKRVAGKTYDSALYQRKV